MQTSGYNVPIPYRYSVHTIRARYCIIKYHTVEYEQYGIGVTPALLLAQSVLLKRVADDVAFGPCCCPVGTAYR